MPTERLPNGDVHQRQFDEPAEAFKLALSADPGLLVSAAGNLRINCGTVQSERRGMNPAWLRPPRA